MSIKQDWLERQIEAIGQGLAALIFGRDKIKKVFEKFEGQEQDSENSKMDETLLDILVDQYLQKGEFLKAEEILFSFIENEQTLRMFMTAMMFYNQLLDLDDERLETGGLSKQKISQSIDRLKQIYKV